MKEKIQIWLDSGADPAEGIILLEQSGVNVLFIRMIKSNPGKNKDLILRELLKISGISSREPKKKNTPGKEKSFRDEFPFLQEPDCPLELKALVTDKFSSFYLYRDLHQKLFDCTNLVGCTRIAGDLINNYLENQLIYAELDYYKHNKVLLGKHPVFKHYNEVKLLRKLSVRELIKKEEQLKHNIWRIESELKKGDKPRLDAERKERIREKQAELAEVQRLLG